jgi:beta-glucosidase
LRRQALAMTTALLLAGTANISIAAEAKSDQQPASVVMNPEIWPQSKSPAALTDAATEAKIDALLARMSVEQKVGQLVQGDISTITPEDLKTYPLGSILAGGNSGPYGNERAGAADWAKLVSEFRAVSAEPAANGVAIPIIFGVDAVHGHNNIPGATLFPHNVGLGAAHDAELIERIGAVTAKEIAASGIEWTFAPSVSVPQDGRWGRAYEGYSSEPTLVATYSAAMVRGLQGELKSGEILPPQKVAATVKHYLGDGGTTAGKDQGDTAVSEAELARIHAPGYPAAIDAGTLTVMASFNSWNGGKSHGHKGLLTDILKGRMGFDGFVVGDWNGHGQVEGCTITDCRQTIMAGLDMVMAPDSWKYLSLVEQAKDGRLPMARVDDAVRRILRVKYKLGLMDAGFGHRGDVDAVGAPDNLAVAREAVSKSLVLLKNNGSVLPIKAGANVLVAGPGADSMAMQSGGWTISWQGTDVTREDFPNGQTIWDGLRQAITENGGKATLSADGSYEQKPDVAVVVFGEEPYAEFQGDVPTLDYQPGDAKDLETLKALKAAGIPVVAVFLSGRPMFTNPEINAADAFVAAWLPGSQGAGVADVLVANRKGKTVRPFTGTLSFPWPADARSPIKDPQFPLGYGLTYKKKSKIGALPEDLGIDLASSLNIDTYFAAGRARSPWTLTLVDDGGQRIVGSPAITSPNGRVSARSVDVRVQEDGKALAWTGQGAAWLHGPAANMKPLVDADRSLVIEWRVDAKNSQPVTLEFGGVRVDLTSRVAALPVGEVSQIQVALRCFADAGADMQRVAYPLMLNADAGFAATLLTAAVDRDSRTLAGACPAVIK